ncbi:hypothetical protein J6590_033176 [Homalodisca vitripennis]|nr:hypothetical protein J6590_033176 [Homalodisca vitripennis]
MTELDRYRPYLIIGGLVRIRDCDVPSCMSGCCLDMYTGDKEYLSKPDEFQSEKVGLHLPETWTQSQRSSVEFQGRGVVGRLTEQGASGWARPGPPTACPSSEHHCGPPVVDEVAHIAAFTTSYQRSSCLSRLDMIKIPLLTPAI